MVILPSDPSLAPQVTEAYNRAVARVPHCYALSPDEYSAAVASSESPHGRGAIRD